LRIFISIAAYRDPELLPTVLDCLAAARYPGQCRFGICWQHGPEEGPLPFSGDRRFRIIEVDWRQSQGACWARAEIMRLWENEEYYLQLDSHHRFAQNWDIELLRYADMADSPRPIITTYGAPFTPGLPQTLTTAPYQVNFDRFTEEGIAVFRPAPVPGSYGRGRPLRARFLSAHFLFTSGSFIKEVPYDPEVYFTGEEISLGIRAFTHGYDLFHPPAVIIWHEYTRSYRRKHWDDHIKAPGLDIAWYERDAASKNKVSDLLMRPYTGRFAFGTVRSFQEYESYAGLNFQYRLASDTTLRGEEPPNPARVRAAGESRKWRVRILFNRAELPPGAVHDPAFWYVGVYDSKHNEIFRQDAALEEIRILLDRDRPFIVIERGFVSDRVPVTWTVWPVSRSQGWLWQVRGECDLAPD
jgi:hypothetical protein